MDEIKDKLRWFGSVADTAQMDLEQDVTLDAIIMIARKRAPGLLAATVGALNRAIEAYENDEPIPLATILGESFQAIDLP